MRRMLIVTAAALLVSALAWAQEAEKPESLESYIPSDAVLYVHYQGLTGAAGTFQQTEVHKLLREPEVQEFGKELSRFIEALMKQKGPNSPVTWADVRMLLDCEIGYALLDVRGRVPSMALVVRAADHADALSAFIDRLVAKAVPTDQPVPEDEVDGVRVKVIGPLCIAWTCGDLVLTSGKETMRKVVRVVKGFDNSIAKNDRYAAAGKKMMGGREFLMAHFDVERLRTLAAETRRAEEVEKVWAVTGLKDVNYLHLCVAPDAPGVKVMLYAHAPQGAKGVFSLLPAKPVDEKAMLASVDEKAPDFAIARMSAGDVFDAIVEMASRADGADRVNDAVAKFNERAGFDLRKDLLASLGDEVTMRTLGAGLQFCLTASVKDDKALAANLEKLVTLASNEMGRHNEGGGGGGLEIEKLDHKGQQIVAVKITGAPIPLTPSYAITGGRLVVATTPQTLKRALDLQNAPAAKSIVNSAAYQALRAHVAAKPGMLSYSETRQGFEDAYGGVITPLVQMLNAAKDSLPPNSLATKFPSADAIAPHLFGTVTAISRDGEGYLVESYGPVASATNGAAGIGILAGFTLPALAKAQEAARRASCMNNTRQIGLAMIQYAGDHDDKFPESFGELVQQGYLTTAKVFFCPSDNRKFEAPVLPENPKAAAVADLDKAITPICSYEMVGGITHAADADTIVLYEKDGAHNGEGRNCFYNDGHVKWLPEFEFAKRMAEQKKRPQANP